LPALNIATQPVILGIVELDTTTAAPSLTLDGVGTTSVFGPAYVTSSNTTVTTPLVQVGGGYNAASDYDAILAKQPKNMDALRARAAALLEAKSYARAANDYDRIIAAEPRNARAYYQRGVAYEQQNERDKALADYKQALVRDKNFADARTAIARVTPTPASRKPEPRVATTTKPDTKIVEEKAKPVEPPRQAAATVAVPIPAAAPAPEPSPTPPQEKSKTVEKPAPVAAREPKTAKRESAKEIQKQAQLKREFEAEQERERLRRKLAERKTAERRQTYYAPPQRYYRAGEQPSRRATFSDAFR
jgi:tetratricopeptide (TPR) repeat protein